MKRPPSFVLLALLSFVCLSLSGCSAWRLAERAATARAEAFEADIFAWVEPVDAEVAASYRGVLLGDETGEAAERTRLEIYETLVADYIEPHNTDAAQLRRDLIAEWRALIERRYR